MARGGKRTGAGRKKNEAEAKSGSRGFYTLVLSFAEGADRAKMRPDAAAMHAIIWERGKDNSFTKEAIDTRRWCHDHRDGKSVQTVNYVHDKPIEMNVSLSIAEVVRKVRERKEQYERSRPTAG